MKMSKEGMSMRIHRRSVLPASALLVLLLAACGQPEQAMVETEADDTASTEMEASFEGLSAVDRSGWETGQPGGSFVRPVLGDPNSLNVAIAAETSTTNITDQLYEPLVRRNQFTLEWEPAAAESYEISDDQRTITLTVREGMRWSDGEAVTAEDFVFAYNHVALRQDVQSNARSGLFIAPEPGSPEEPVRVRLIDEFTLSITLPTVYAGIMQIANSIPIPVHIFGPLIGFNAETHGWDFDWSFGEDEEGNQVIVEDTPEGVDYSAINSFWGVDADPQSVVGNGPFRLVDYVPAQRVVMERNEYYWETDAAGTPLPYLDQLVYQIVEDQDTMLQRFIAGDLDTYGLRGEDYSELIGRREELGFTIYEVGADSSTQFITFNQNPIEGEDDAGISDPELSWLSERSFRQAMAHLIDRETIIDNIAFGFGYPQYSFVPRISPYYWEGADEAAFQYDPQRAADLLDSIDFIDRDGDGVREDAEGNPIILELNTNSGNRVREAIGELFAQEASAVGIQINFRPEEFNALVTRLVSTYDWELILIGLTGSVDPISGANVYPSSGNLHMIEPSQSSPRRAWEAAVDEAWIEANNTTDEQQRITGFRTIQEIWIEEVPWAYTFNPLLMAAYGSAWGNVKPQPVDGYGFSGIAHRLYQR